MRGITSMSILVLAGLILAVSSAPAAPAGAAAVAAAQPPRAEPRHAIDTYWGEPVADDYQYLEQVGDPAVRQWAEAQNAYTRARLAAFPERAALEARVEELTHDASPDWYALRARGGKLFAIKRQPPKQQPFLVVIESLDDPAAQRAVVDPNVIDPEFRTAIDFYVPSHDARHVAVSLSRDGTEDGTLQVYEVATGEPVDVAIPRVNGGTAGGAVAWTAAGDGFYYTRYPYPGERPDADLPFYQQIWFHRLGTPLAADHYVLGESFPRIAEIELAASDDGRWLLAEVSNGDGGEYEYWLHGPERDWTRFARFEDWVQRAAFGADGAVYLLSRKDAPRKQLLRMPVERPELDAARIVVPESEAVITDFAATASRLFVCEMAGGPTRLHAYDLAGRSLAVIGDGELLTISGLVRFEDGGLLFRRQTYVEPPAWRLLPAGGETPRATALRHTSPADFGGCDVQRIFATADDGTRIPIDVIRRRATPLDGIAPLLLYGYGSYGISQTPSFSASRLVWIEQGGIYAVACVRGGGEYGDAWHRAANLEHKQVSMDDFAACARTLVEQGYTAAERLAIEGGSAGGLLVYGTMVRHPERMAAVVARVGIADALRTELSPNGEFNITEFGTVKDETQFRGMLAYSPYHNVRDGQQYPAVLALTGMNDPRVEPWQSFKMTAALQASGSRRPALLRVSMHTGHGRGTSLSERDAQLADIYSFLFGTLGVRYRPVAVGAAPPPGD